LTAHRVKAIDQALSLSLRRLVSSPDVVIRPAGEGDVAGIVAVLAANLDEPSLFQRSERDVARHVSDFIVAEGERDHILACAALHRHTPTLGEVLSVAVLPEVQGLGIGSRLLEECARRAREAGIRELWLATTKPAYFTRFGYQAGSRARFLLASSAILVMKLEQLYEQPLGRWLPALLGRHTFMVRSV
jgi:N-acetylglutamate synthase-like GNAT family acetyltransferase